VLPNFPVVSAGYLASPGGSEPLLRGRTKIEHFCLTCFAQPVKHDFNNFRFLRGSAGDLLYPKSPPLVIKAP